MNDHNFKNCHRTDSKDFTRDRKLTFSAVISLIFQKSMKSIQLILNEMYLSKIFDFTVTNSAFTQARAKLKHTAFIELNERVVVETMYEDAFLSKTPRIKFETLFLTG